MAWRLGTLAQETGREPYQQGQCPGTVHSPKSAGSLNKNKFCTGCRYRVTDSVKFCPQCGLKVADAVRPPGQCECGRVFGPQEKFCGSCGKPVVT